MSGSTNRSAPTGRHRRPRRSPGDGTPPTTPFTFDAVGPLASDRAGPGPVNGGVAGSRDHSGRARSLRAAGAGVGVAIAGVVLSALAPAAAQAAEGPGLNAGQEERLRTAEREYRADVNHDDDLSESEKQCMRDASWARVRAMNTPAETRKVRPQQHDACRIEVSLPAVTADAADLPPTFTMPGDPKSPFKSGAQINRERALVLAEKLDDQWHLNQMKADPTYRPPILDFEPDVDPTNPFKPIELF